MEYYTAERKKELLPFTTAWMSLEVMLIRISLSEKDKYHTILLICGIKEYNNLLNKIGPEAWIHGTD